MLNMIFNIMIISGAVASFLVPSKSNMTLGGIHQSGAVHLVNVMANNSQASSHEASATHSVIMNRRPVSSTLHPRPSYQLHVASSNLPPHATATSSTPQRLLLPSVPKVAYLQPQQQSPHAVSPQTSQVAPSSMPTISSQQYYSAVRNFKSGSLAPPSTNVGLPTHASAGLMVSTKPSVNVYSLSDPAVGGSIMTGKPPTRVKAAVTDVPRVCANHDFSKVPMMVTNRSSISSEVSSYAPSSACEYTQI